LFWVILGVDSLTEQSFCEFHYFGGIKASGSEQREEKRQEEDNILDK